jgi:hypothetical protein
VFLLYLYDIVALFSLSDYQLVSKRGQRSRTMKNKFGFILKCQEEIAE